MGRKKQYFNVKFPFVCDNENALFVDLNENYDEKINSEIAHVILTPKGRRVRMPDFGTDLIKYIFEPNDGLSWESVENEIRVNVNKYIPSVEITKVEVLQENEQDNSIYVDIRYSIKRGNNNDNNRMVIKL
jgi:phage baseplate assembly protein W